MMARTVAACSALVVVLGGANQFASGHSLFDAVADQLSGSPGTVLQVLTEVVVVVGWSIPLVMSQTGKARALARLRALRYGSFGRWARRTLAREFALAGGFVVVLAISAFVGYLLAGGRSFETPACGIGVWFLQFLANSYGAIAVCLALVFLVTTIFPSRPVGLGVIAVLVGAIAYPATAPWYPFGAIGMWRVAAGSAAVESATIGAYVTLGTLCAVTFALGAARKLEIQ